MKRKKTSPLVSRKKRVRPSRPQRRPQSKTGSARLTALDTVNERCERIQTLAGLLNACDDPGALDARLVGCAGYFIAEDLRQVKELLAEFGKGTP
jgi:hypothetical protein